MELKDSIFNFAYEMALRDATIQNAYDGADKKKLRENVEAKNLVKQYILDIFSGNNPCFYHTENKVEQSFALFIKDEDLKRNKKESEKHNNADDHPSFSFGNTQKLINMTAKYMFITAYDSSDSKEKFKCCHCPMDSIMVETVINKIGELCKKDEHKKRLNENLKCDGKTWRQCLREPWSKMNASEEKMPRSNEQYELFQYLVSYLCQMEQITPLEFDFIYWNSATEKARD